MTDNPYEAPSSPTTTTRLDFRRKSTARPVGISILASLHFLGGVMLIGVQLLMFAVLGELEESLSSIGVPPVLLIAGIIILAMLMIASGVGMWMGTKWGWWLASFYYVHNIFRHGFVWFTAIAMADAFEDGIPAPEYLVLTHGGAIVGHFLLFLYLFKANVLAFFGLEALDKGKAVGVLVGICLAMMAAMSAISLIGH